MGTIRLFVFVDEDILLHANRDGVNLSHGDAVTHFDNEARLHVPTGSTSLGEGKRAWLGR